MPHKHRRAKDANEDDHYELPPTERARPLSTSKGVLFTEDASKKKGAKRKRANKDDDTPAAFKRLMAFKQGIKPRSGLDDGTRIRKKSSANQTPIKEPKVIPEPAAIAVPKPTIRPGERMNDFSARVDAALPVIGLAKKAPVRRNADGTRKPNSKAEKRQQNMQKEWREIDAKYKERLAEAEEEANDEYEEIWRPVHEGAKKKRKKNKSTTEDDEGDPWAVVGKARSTPSGTLVGIHDVVQDVPRFTVNPKEKMKMKHGAMVDVENVPQMSGSLRRREELSDSRRKIIEAYRGLAKGRTRSE